MKRNLALLILGCGSVTLACDGYIEGNGSGFGPADGQVVGPPGTGSITGPGTGTQVSPTDAVTLLQNPPEEPTVSDIACTAQAVVPAGRIWRLSAEGYKNSVQAATGYAAIDNSAAPLDSVAENKFATSSRQNVVSQPWADWFFDQGAKIGDQTVAALPAQFACVTLPNATPACVQGFIKEYATKLFRRPLTTDETARYQTTYTQWAADPELGPKDAAAGLIDAWTMSPNHVFRTELGDSKPGPVALTQYEIASELSFLFADSAPDALLLADAQQSKLTDLNVVRGHAERLLSGPAGRQVLKHFFHEFLHLRELAGGGVDVAQTSLVPSMEAEMEAFVEGTLFDRNGGLDTLLTSTTSTVDAPLAAFYGVSAGANVDTKRPGLLHQAAFLNTRRDATRRGLFVAGELLCTPPSPPPPDAVAMASKLMFDEDATGREIQQTIQSAGVVCKSCHATFAPMGLAFEHYDKLGKFRTQQNGKDIDVTGAFLGNGDLSAPFTDSVDMVRQVLASNQGQLCFSKRFVSYLEGRNAHGVLDGCLISRARTQMAQNKFSLQKFMVELTQDPSFYKRINLQN